MYIKSNGVKSLVGEDGESLLGRWLGLVMRVTHRIGRHGQVVIHSVVDRINAHVTLHTYAVSNQYKQGE